MFRSVRGRQATRLARVAIVVAAVEILVGVVAGSVVARSATPRADLLLPARVANGIVPRKLQPVLGRLRAPARTAVESRRTALGRALALERVVHTAVRATGADCAGFATVMVALGRSLGMPVRLTFAGTGISSYDTHTTVSVWLPRYRRWGIVDPTFGGTFSRGSDPRPLNALDLRDSLRRGWWRQVRWHPSAANSTPLSSYYVDPLFLFREVGIYVYSGQSAMPLVLPDSRRLIDARYVTSRTVLAAAPPDRFIRARLPSDDGAGKPRDFPLPPAYAPREIWHGRVTLPATIAVPRGSVVVWSGKRDVRVSGYRTALVDGGSLSPIFVSNGTVTLGGRGVSAVRIFAALRFPSSPRG